MGEREVRLGEKLGYALAFVVLGPVAALQRRARQTMRAAMLAWITPLSPVTLVAPRGFLRRSASLPTSTGAIGIDVELDAFANLATIAVPLPPLPNYVVATVCRATWVLTGLRSRMTEALASEGTLRIESEALDRDGARALLDHVLGSSLGRLGALKLEIRSREMAVLVAAPTSVAEWTALAEGITGMVEWLRHRWPASYRS